MIYNILDVLITVILVIGFIVVSLKTAKNTNKQIDKN